MNQIFSNPGENPHGFSPATLHPGLPWAPLGSPGLPGTVRAPPALVGGRLTRTVSSRYMDESDEIFAICLVVNLWIIYG